jgi:L-malate glycosyltransferase
MKHKICVVCPHPVGYAPGQRLKYEQYFESWELNGYDVDVSPFMSESMQQIVYKKGHFFAKIKGVLGGYFRRIALLFKIRRYDIAYVFLWATPFGPPIFEWIICRLAKKIIFDIDDLVFLKNNPHEKKYLSWIKGKNKPIYLMKNADHVITCTPYLDNFARQFNSNTTDISSTINTETYIPVNSYKNDHILVLGWSGSHTTAKYLYLLKDVLLELNKKITFKLLVMGDDSFNIEGLDVEAISWKEEYEVQTLQRMDIGLYPLPLDEEWVLGKSGLKALQYMALGIPTIATNVGCNNRVMIHEESGLLVKTKEEWLVAFEKLMNNKALRKQIGEKARQRVENLYSIKATAPVYLQILEKVKNK